MSVKETYVSYPLKTGESVRGLVETRSVNELKRLYSLDSLGNKILNIPTKDSSKFPSTSSPELTNLFENNSGGRIVFISDLFSQFQEVSIP